MYVGRTGVAYVFMKLYEASGKHDFYELSLQVIRELKEKILQKTLPCDLLNGMAGNVFSITYLYSVTGEKFLLELIDQGLYNLVEKALISEKGLKWGFHRKNVNSLCGMSHGASGIAYCLLEIGRYFKKDAYLWLAEQGMAYEEQFYNASINNWKDLRLPLNEERAMEALVHDPDYLINGNGLDLNHWTHGAAGIGLVRWKAFDLLKKEKFRREAELAIQKTIRTDILEGTNENYIYTQGKAGNAELFLEAYCVTQNEEYLNYATIVAQELVNYFQENGKLPRHNQVKDREDPIELFLGSTGLAYFLLRYLDPYKTDSILAPVLPDRVCTEDLEPYQMLRADVPALRKIIYGKYFARTLTCLQGVKDDNTDTIYQYPVVQVDYQQDYNGLIEEIKSRINKISEETTKNCLSEILSHESHILTMLAENTSYAFIHATELRQTENSKRIAQLTEKEISKLRIRKVNNSTVKQLGWNWETDSAYERNLNTVPGEFAVFLKKRIQYVHEIYLNTLSELILRSLKEGNTIEELNENTLRSIEKEDLTALSIPGIKEKWIKSINRQIRLLLEAGLLEIH